MITIRGSTLAELGVKLVEPAPTFGFAGVERTGYAMPGRLGSIPSRVAVGREKAINLRLVIDTDMAGRQDGIDALLAHLDGLVDLAYDFAPDRRYWGFLDTVPISALFDSIAFVDGDVAVDCAFRVPSGSAVATSGTVLAVGTDPTPVTGLGVRVPSEPVIVIPGAVTDPWVRYTSPTGEVLAELALTGTVGVAETLEIHVPTLQLILVDQSDGSRDGQAGAAFYVPGSSGSFPVLDPGDAIGMTPPGLSTKVASTAYYVARFP